MHGLPDTTDTITKKPRINLIALNRLRAQQHVPNLKVSTQQDAQDVYFGVRLPVLSAYDCHLLLGYMLGTTNGIDLHPLLQRQYLNQTMKEIPNCPFCMTPSHGVVELSSS